MSKLITLPLTAEHLEAIRLRSDHAAYVTALGNAESAVNASLVRGGGATLLAPEGVVACAGISILWEGVGQLWMRVGELAEAYGMALARVSRRYVQASWGVYGLRRLQATVMKNNSEAVRFINWLGFKPEGFMRGYGPEGADYVMFAKVRG